ncbi:MAG: AraC family transcriptional regulator [Tunicatimonas sp.]
MEISEVRLFKELNRSFILHHEKTTFSGWHYHPEYELVLITKGRGKRVVGDSIERFEAGDLVFLGSYLPHEWRCDASCYRKDGSFLGEGLVIQFLPDFLGPGFFELAENAKLKSFLTTAAQGCFLHGDTRDTITASMMNMTTLSDTHKLYQLLSIFQVLSETNEYDTLSTPAFVEPYHSDELVPMKRVIDHIMTNFQKQIKIKELQDLSNMSNTTFFKTFKKTFQMSFKTYLINLRIGYSCKLLADKSLNVTQIAYQSGFENISNFNRQFKVLKGCTPREYRKELFTQYPRMASA